ncbi:MAG: threonylcarbamoyl-AMP synthase [Burkholderiaceae bacterium]|nr:threonylcarbamoyl-AMP synthase [Burkholderiaceae bacterium]
MPLSDALPRPFGPRNDVPRYPSLRDGNTIDAIEAAAQALARGDLVAFPTETVYGLGADGLNPIAAQRIFAVKGRPADHPVILHVGSVEAAKRLASDWPPIADQLARAFWPGPLTLILKRAAGVPDVVTGGQDTVGVRMPSHLVAIRLLTEFAKLGSGVVAAPSANRFGGVSPTRAADVAASIGDRLAENDLILDGGDCDVGVESTIIDLSADRPRLLRPGGVTREAIEALLGMPLGQSDVNAPRVSGSLESHYAPKARAMLLTANALRTQLHVINQPAAAPSRRIACLVMDESLIQWLSQRSDVICMPMSSDPKTYAHDLYARFNDADWQDVEMLLIESPPSTPAWEAVNDRLKRATAH